MKKFTQGIVKTTRLQETAEKLKYVPIKNLNEGKLAKASIKEILLSANYQERIKVTLKHGYLKKIPLKKEEAAVTILRDTTKNPTKTVEFCHGGSGKAKIEKEVKESLIDIIRNLCDDPQEAQNILKLANLDTPEKVANWSMTNLSEAMTVIRTQKMLSKFNITLERNDLKVPGYLNPSPDFAILENKRIIKYVDQYSPSNPPVKSSLAFAKGMVELSNLPVEKEYTFEKLFLLNQQFRSILLNFYADFFHTKSTLLLAQTREGRTLLEKHETAQTQAQNTQELIENNLKLHLNWSNIVQETGLPLHINGKLVPHPLFLITHGGVSSPDSPPSFFKKVEELYHTFKRVIEIDQRAEESTQKIQSAIQKDTFQKDELRNALSRLKMEAGEKSFDIENLEQKARLKGGELQVAFSLKSTKIEEL